MSDWLYQIALKTRSYFGQKIIWQAINKLIILGDNNGEAQNCIDNAKDSLYRAIKLMKQRRDIDEN